MPDKRLDYDYRPITKNETNIVLATYILASYGLFSLVLDLLHHFL